MFLIVKYQEIYTEIFNRTSKHFTLTIEELVYVRGAGRGIFSVIRFPTSGIVSSKKALEQTY